jgi:hypothetical protein
MRTQPAYRPAASGTDYGARPSRFRSALDGYPVQHQTTRMISQQTEIEPEPVPLPSGQSAAVFEDGAFGDMEGYGCGAACDSRGPCLEFEEMYAMYAFRYWFRNVSIFAGVHGFKSAVDAGSNGNFGLNEGINLGGALGDPWGFGYQIGVAGYQSNISGQMPNGNVRRGPGFPRDQLFVTAGLFRRAACGGFQGGVAFDTLQDNYYDKATLKQIRSELSYVFAGGTEIGYFGAYGTGDDAYFLYGRTVVFEPTDMYAAFIRRQFQFGGEGRFWGGATGNGDGILGVDLRMPLTYGWAVENRMTYLIPREHHGGTGPQREAWGLTVQLVWTPGDRRKCGSDQCFRPLFNVADNATFLMTNRHPDQGMRTN